MGVPTSEVGYTSAMPRREDHEVHKDMWGIGKIYIIILYISATPNCVVSLHECFAVLDFHTGSILFCSAVL